MATFGENAAQIESKGKEVRLFDLLDSMRIKAIDGIMYVDLGSKNISVAVALRLTSDKAGHYIVVNGHYLYYNGFCATTDNPLESYKQFVADIWPK
jgi:hypothetical protein